MHQKIFEFTYMNVTLGLPNPILPGGGGGGGGMYQLCQLMMVHTLMHHEGILSSDHALPLGKTHIYSIVFHLDL